uniref:uncharacterized protein LOC122608983 n=1 Tax=Erigeron canadensis TaxID=72917 RepID=UPI001CB985A1|nr:uncharacterized protein LOC122608983 [Erigeron canadensis]
MKIPFESCLTCKPRKKFSSNRGTLFTPTRPQRDVLAAERLPPRDRSKGKEKDLTKFCEFHNDHGHDTNDCRILKIKMKEAMKTGRLSNLIKELKEQHPKNDQRRQNVVEPMGPKQEPLDEPIMMVKYARERHFTEGERQRWEQTAITFPMLPPDEGTEGPILIKAVIGNHPVNRVHLDTGSGCEIMYEHCFLKLRAALRMKRRDSGNALVGFSGEKSCPLGEINLKVVIGEHPRTRMEELTFIIIRAESPYNVILGRTAMRRMGIIPSPLHGLAMFPTRNGVGCVRSEYRKPHHCAQVEAPTSEAPKPKKLELNNEAQKIFINPEYPDQSISIGKQLPTKVKKQLKDMLRLNKDVFAWAPSDMIGVPRQLKFGDEVFDTQHRLNVRPHVEPIKQKRMSLAPERERAAQEQVSDLVKAGILREVKYQSWVANPVMVKKHDGGWRMCMDFTDINKACPKDCYLLPEIDWKVESLMGFKLKCFLDAYKGYHQIQMHKDDEEKTAFYTGEGIYCFKKMPFGLKNAGATYQRLIDKAFSGQIGRNLEAYVDDMVIKSRTEEDMLWDIQETLETLRSIGMKLNPKKCHFGMKEGQFLGHIITKQGIRPDSKKVKEIKSMKSPRTLKEVQSLNGKLAALHRFLSKSADRSLPFFKTLKGCTDKQSFHWTPEAEKAFVELKEYLDHLPTMVAPGKGEVLQMYLATSEEVVSAVLMANVRDNQMPVYYVSRVLQGPETRYSEIEKLALALIHAARRLRRYFQAHTIQVLTNKPIKQVLARPEASGRLAKWAIELGEHEIEFRPRSSIKGQVLADFIAETPVKDAKKKRKEPEVTLPEDAESSSEDPVWKLFTDGASSADGSGAGLILTSPEGKEFTYALRFNFKASNNAAEYEALLAGLRIAKAMGVKHVHAHVDSQIVAFQVNGTYEAKEPLMKKYLEKVKEIKEKFRSFRISNISRNKNKIADALSKLASTSFAHLTEEVLVEVLEKRSIEEPEVNVIEEEGPTWMTPNIEYLTSGLLPADRDQARKIRVKAPQYELQEEGLYKRSYMGPLLRCVGPNQAKGIIHEVHRGSCGLHAGPRMVIAKIGTMGYY